MFKVIRYSDEGRLNFSLNGKHYSLQEDFDINWYLALRCKETKQVYFWYSNIEHQLNQYNAKTNMFVKYENLSRTYHQIFNFKNLEKMCTSLVKEMESKET